MSPKLSDFVDDLLDVIMGFRKFIAFLCIFNIGIIFRCKGLVDGNQFVSLMNTAFTGFVASNSVEHFVSMVKDHLASKAQAAAKEVLNKEES